MSSKSLFLVGTEAGVVVLLVRWMGMTKLLRAAPLSRSLLLGSHVASGAITALVLLAIIYAAAIAIFGVRIDCSVAGFVAIAIAFALLTSSFGLLIAAIGKTPEATRGLAIFATLVMVMLGGAWVPSFVFPQWLQTASLSPTRWAVDGLDGMTWRGPAPTPVAPVVVLLGHGAVHGDRDSALRLGAARLTRAGVLLRAASASARLTPSHSPKSTSSAPGHLVACRVTERLHGAGARR
jgi:ABC-2 type transport system permease protein